jgi:hypothetical protein
MKTKLIIVATAIVFVVVIFFSVFMYGKKTPTNSPTPTPEPTTDPFFSPEPSFIPTNNPGDFACPSSWIGLTDLDNDGLPDITEQLYKTNQTASDTDEDGYSDRDEVKNGFDPLIKIGNPKLDSDQDGLNDNEECKYGSDPFNKDSDGDGFEDGNEVKNGYDPTRAGSFRLSTTPSATPIPTVSFTPTPISVSTPTPAPPTKKPIASIPPIDVTKLIISKDNSAVAIATYLKKVDEVSLTDFATGTQFSSALISAFNGDGSKLKTVIANLKKHETQLSVIATPEIALIHQKLLISLSRYVNEQLTEIADNAGKSREAQLSAAENLQTILAKNLELLKTERKKLEAVR